MESGTIKFSSIKRLPAEWWKHPESVWTVWDKNCYYLWGANSGNYDLKQGDSLMGGGMAGSHGPTLGYAHDHYIGIDTMDYSEVRNPAQFKKLQALLASGHDIVIPTFKGCYSLGTGIAHQNPGWTAIQKQIFEGILSLIDNASDLQVPDHTFWPDCRTKIKMPDGAGGEVSVSICDRTYRSKLDDTTGGCRIIKDRSDIKTIISVLS